MSTVSVFSIDPSGSKNITAGSSSANVALHRSNCTVLVTNAGDNDAFIEFGDSTVTAAAATSKIVKSGHEYAVRIGAGETHVAAIAPSGSPAIYFATGDGV